MRLSLVASLRLPLQTVREEMRMRAAPRANAIYALVYDRQAVCQVQVHRLLKHGCIRKVKLTRQTELMAKCCVDSICTRHAIWSLSNGELAERPLLRRYIRTVGQDGEGRKGLSNQILMGALDRFLGRSIKARKTNTRGDSSRAAASNSKYNQSDILVCQVI